MPIGTTGDGRGTWTRNRVIISNANDPYTLDPNVRKLLVLAPKHPDGPDACWSFADSDDITLAVDNNGRYGCVYMSVYLSCFFDPAHYGTLEVYLATMNTGGSYAGVLRRPSDIDVQVTPILKYNDPQHSKAVLIERRVIPQPPAPGTGIVQFNLAHAGGATLPVALLCRTV